MPYEFPADHRAIIDRIKENDQKHVLRWLGEVSEEEREAFLGQLEDVDFDLVSHFERLIREGVHDPDVGEVTPANVIQLARNTKGDQQESAVRSTGRKALQGDRVVAVTVAGGQGTRLGYDGPKGTYPITPIRGRSLFQVLAEKIQAARRTYRCRLPWLIMTSRVNDDQTRAFFADHEFFGLEEDTVHFFTQSDNPILGPNGRLLLADKGKLLVGPDGHGGFFGALHKSGLAERMLEEHFDLISYFQVDNPLIRTVDERFIGHHIQYGADFSCKVVAKRDPAEKLGVAVTKNGRPGIVEYANLPEATARETTPNGQLKYRYGNIAAHVMDLEFAARMGSTIDALPWHIAKREYASLDENGDPVRRTCYKFERYVFDCLAHASGCAFVETRREREFAPVKNATGEDSPESCRTALKNLWVSWLRQCGFDVGELRNTDDKVEISPSFANSAAELARKLPAGFRPVPPVVLEPSDD